MAPASPPRRRIAVVGAGISGLTAAYLLAPRHDVTLYEAQPRLGGHTHTHDVTAPDGTRLAIDSGFIVHNDRTYPLLRRLFDELGVQTRPTEMSMSIRSERTGVEYAGGRGLKGMLANPAQLRRSDLRTTLLGVPRFFALARRFLAETDETDPTTYGEFLRGHGFGPDFHELYAIPLISCVWSSGRGEAMEYPAHYLFRFLDNHGMLRITGSPQWRTVVGGSSDYVHRIASRLGDVRTDAEVVSVLRSDEGVEVTSRGAGGVGTHRHDAVVVATHADQALHLLADASPLEKEVLGAFRYSRNQTVLHTDGALMPRARQARAAWNYLAPTTPRPSGPVATYWMNRLQGLPGREQYYVSLNATDLIDPARVLATMEYEHPVYDLAMVRAQRRLPELTSSTTAFAGAHHAWGFHEDGCRSGVAAAAAFGVTW